MISQVEQEYFNLIKRVLSTGIKQKNRTAEEALSVNGAIITADLREGFPVMTASKRGYKYVAAELECFIKGITDKREFQKRKCTIWDEWCCPKKVPYSHDEETYKKMREEYELGPVYGAQWRCFDGKLDENYCLEYGSGTDQLKRIVEDAKQDPTSRRLICTALNPNHYEYMGLLPCVFCWQINIDVNNNCIDLTYYQRSCDLMLGVPADIESYSMLLILLAKELGYTPRFVTALMNNVHIYESHIDGAKELLQRETYQLPQIHLTKFTSVYDFEYTDFVLENYVSGKKINFNVTI